MAVIKADDSNFESLLAENPNAIVKYYASWCGSCRLIAPKFKRLSEENADIGFIEVDAENSPESRKKAGVNNLPFFAIFKNSKLVEGDAGAKEEFILSLIGKLNNGH